MWNTIKNFFKKGWTLLILPMGMFFISLFRKSSKSELKKKIKEEEKEIKEIQKAVEEKKEQIEEQEEVIEKQVGEIINKEPLKKEKTLTDILPDLKRDSENE